MSSSSKTNVSVEYAHIYTNNRISEEQVTSVDVLGGVQRDLEKRGETYSLVVMVDDYSFPDPSFDYETFVAWLKKEGHSPDVVMRESQLIPLCDEVLKHLQDQKLKSQLIDYIKIKKYPCSLFIAAWYLLRLGYLSYSGFDSIFYADRLLNILPVSFKPFEDKGLEIIAATSFSGAEKRIEYRFLEGRIIA